MMEHFVFYPNETNGKTPEQESKLFVEILPQYGKTRKLDDVLNEVGASYEKRIKELEAKIEAMKARSFTDDEAPVVEEMRNLLNKVAKLYEAKLNASQESLAKINTQVQTTLANITALCALTSGK